MRPRIAVAVVFALLAACGTAKTRAPEPTGSGSVAVSLPKASPAAMKRIVAAAALVRFADCGAVTRTLRAKALPYVTADGLPGTSYPAYAALAAGAAEDKSAAAPTAATPQAGVDYSTTNLQEQGVGEPDLSQSNGRAIFAVSNGTLHSAVISSDTPHLVGSLRLGSSDAQLLLEGDKLMAIGSDQNVSAPPPGGVEPMEGVARPGVMMPAYPYNPKTLVQIIDVSTPSAMRVTSTLHLDGSYIAARAVNGVARIVIRTSSPSIGFVTPRDPSPAASQQALDTNRSLVAKADVAKWVPRYTLHTSKGDSSGVVSSCGSVYMPPVYSGLSTVSVVSVDPANPTPKNGSTVVGGGEMVYASTRNIYVTAQKWQAPSPVATVPSPITEQTQIHKFSIGGVYLASGLVNGTLLSSYAMSEDSGVLRVATTSNGYAQNSSSAVTDFAQQDKALVPVGSVGGLGAGEQIRGVRFIGSLGYVVTFRQTDPLYVVDLSKPAAPKVVGELKIPGFSAYLHPVGDGLLLGVGEVADAEGHVHDEQGHWFGTKVSLFDVHDPAHPAELATHVIAGGQSAVENEPHAFLWWEPRKLAVVPISSYDPSSFRGAVGMRVDRTVTEVGRIPDPDSSSTDYFDPGIERTFVVGDRVYTLSATGIGSYDITSFARKAWLPFPT